MTADTFDIQSPGETVAAPLDDGYGTCPDCAKRLKLKADGGLRSHKCENGDDTVTTVTPVKSVTRSRKSRAQAPDKVRTLAVAVLASGIEWTTDTMVSKATDIPVAELPDVLDVPDADAMIGPFVNLAWPQIPKGAQKALIELADHEDLIAACFAWWQWAQTVKQFTETVNAAKTKREATPHGIEISEPTTGGTFQPLDYVDTPASPLVFSVD